MAIVDLDRQQGLALFAEMISTRNLLGYSLRIIRTASFIETTREPILTMLSIGMEKLYKLALGLIILERDHKWPSKSEMKKQGHNLVPMHAAVMNELQARIEGKSHYLRELVTRADNDPVVAPIIEALNLYGRMGRFYYLDQLGDAPQAISPETAWQKIEQCALADPKVAVLHRQATQNVGDSQAWDELACALRQRIATAVECIWVSIAVCGQNHVLGETGVVFGFEIHPDAVGRQ